MISFHCGSAKGGTAGAFVLLAVICLCGCGPESATVYSVAKTAPPTNAEPSLPAGHPDISGQEGRAAFAWKTPAGWTEALPGEMRVASFRVKAADGKEADVSVIPLPGLAGGDAANVNRWRAQLNLAPESEEALQKSAEPVEAWGRPAALYDISGANPGGEGAGGILAAIQRREGTAWFFKMTGDAGVVAKEKPAFLEFLKSFRSAQDVIASLPPSHPPLTAPASAEPVNREGQPKWQAPADWKEASAGQFLVAKFVVGPTPEAQAVVNVSRSTGDGGGLEANVNRWRGQLGQPAWTPAELSQNAKEIQIQGGTASFVEMREAEGRSARTVALAAAVVKHGNEVWFYKLMGDSQVVDGQKDAFLNFVKGVAY